MERKTLTKEQSDSLFKIGGTACIKVNLPEGLFPTKKIPEFVEKLKQFKKVAFELSALWNEIDHTGDYFAAKYPFSKSFDEMVIDINDWYEANEQCKN